MTIATRPNDVIMTPDEARQMVEEHRTAFSHNTKASSFDAGENAGISVPIYFSTPGVHPYAEVIWTRDSVHQTNYQTGETVFRQDDVEFPDFWSPNARTIVTTKYFRGALNTEDREYSLKQVIDRVAKTYRLAGELNGYFATSEDAENFEREMIWLLLHQHFAFNSPVWFNVGTKEPQQVSACFILAVHDSMESILDWYREEGLIFKGGSGAGLNISAIRSSKELLSSGGTASGPISFMRGADASAGTIKSGGATRRAAKMVILDVDHPDVREFIWCKAHEEDKIRALKVAGFDMEVNGKDIMSVQYQNANNSVRVTDEFMRAVESAGDFALKARKDGATVETVNAKELFREIAEAAWQCADPGLQFHDTINHWHTNPNTGPITGSNPCSEYMSLDNSSCNLASLRLTKFEREDGSFDVERFSRAVELVITAMDISICFADFPTKPITDTTHRFRQLGIGYADLGALLMRNGLPYDSDAGRTYAAAISSLMQAVAYRRSAELAGVVGTYEGYRVNEEPHKRVISLHTAASNQHQPIGPIDGEVWEAASAEWTRCQQIGEVNGYRNAQASVLAPTGTIGFMMDCDTTGVEPDFALVKHKKLVGGGSMDIVNQAVTPALVRLGYTGKTIETINEYIAANGHVSDAPGLKPEHYAVFDCAMGSVRSISPMGHVLMMAAVQPFISGSISKTVNMPANATVEEIEEIYFNSWKLGVKALAIYRDGCKAFQPLSDAKAKTAEAEVVAGAPTSPVRKKLPKQRPSRTTSFSVGGSEGYLTAGSYPGDGLGEIFVKLGKQGSTLSGVADAFSIAVSLGLQYGVPLEAYVSKFANMRFEPAGMTDDTDIRMAQSIMDYIFRRLALDYLAADKRSELGIFSAAERTVQVEAAYDPVAVETGIGDPVTKPRAVTPTVPEPVPAVHDITIVKQLAYAPDAPFCPTCGTKMRPAGSCYVCEGCGNTSGCS